MDQQVDLGSSDESEGWEKVELLEDDPSLQRICVVERIYSCSYQETEDSLNTCRAVKKGEDEGIEVYFDTSDRLFGSKMSWLRKRGGPCSGWSIASLVENTLCVITNKDTVTDKLRADLGEDGSIEEIVERRLEEIGRYSHRKSYWVYGDIEVELSRRGELQTATIKTVGDIGTALLDLDRLATNICLLPFRQTLAA